LRRSVKADNVLLFWRRYIDSAVAEACKTRWGVPTDSAILERWWIEEHKPDRKDAVEWERSFACACGWLNLDAEAERMRLVAVIEETLRGKCIEFVRTNILLRRAAVLSCAGIPTAVGKQYEMPLVSTADYEHVAGVEHGDPANITMPPVRAAFDRMF